jgi:hypothetical protein
MGGVFVGIDWPPRHESRGGLSRMPTLDPLPRTLTRSVPDFRLQFEWKSHRNKPRVARNSEDHVREVSRIAMSTTDERVRIAVLQILNSISWPTASVLG